jgi:GNAT superfamily N-acetyltransferase
VTGEGDQVVIRAAVEGDLAEIIALIAELAEYEQLAHEAVATADDLRAHLFGDDPAAHVLIVEAGDGSVAGMALWFRTFSTFLGVPGIWLEDLFVRPAHRGNGYGRALLERLRSMTDGRVEWAVLDWNEPSIAFYRSLGAQPVDGWTRYRWEPTAGGHGGASG